MQYIHVTSIISFNIINIYPHFRAWRAELYKSSMRRMIIPEQTIDAMTEIQLYIALISVYLHQCFINFIQLIYINYNTCTICNRDSLLN